MADVQVQVELGPLFAEMVKAGVAGSDVYVIQYETHDGGEYSHHQTAAVCRSLSRAEQWLVDESKGKSWSDLAYLEGSGVRMRLITNFAEDNRSAYSIQKFELI